MEKLSRQEEILQQYRPKRKEGIESNYVPKSELFVKSKTFINKQTGLEESIKADWINISLNGNKIALFKDKAITESELANFNEDAKKHYLDLVDVEVPETKQVNEPLKQIVKIPQEIKPKKRRSRNKR